MFNHVCLPPLAENSLVAVLFNAIVSCLRQFIFMKPALHT
jgi:hypothetical protein